MILLGLTDTCLYVPY